jgi:hypothetical protein
LHGFKKQPPRRVPFSVHRSGHTPHNHRFAECLRTVPETVSAPSRPRPKRKSNTTIPVGRPYCHKQACSQLDVEPAKYFVLVTKREKRACRSCEELGSCLFPRRRRPSRLVQWHQARFQGTPTR